MIMKLREILGVMLIIAIMLITVIVVYAYNSGSCKINKSYNCDENFCLLKEFHIVIPEYLHQCIKVLLENKDVQKRVNITSYVENIWHCAIPNKKGITISTENIIKLSPKIIEFYQNNLKKIISELLQIDVYSTDLSLPTSCALLIYENEGDWINWHYDYNYYDGRFFTVLIPITNKKTCTQFQLMDDDGRIQSFDLINGNSIIFEGHYLYHRASKLCKNQKRVILSCQYVTVNQINVLNRLRVKFKDFAYTGKLW